MKPTNPNTLKIRHCAVACDMAPSYRLALFLDVMVVAEHGAKLLANFDLSYSSEWGCPK